MTSKLISIVGILFLPMFSFGQTSEDFLIELEEIQITNSPSVHAFVHAEMDDKVLVIGGRVDGLHQRQPFASFLASDNNTVAYVIDLSNNTTYSTSLNVLPTSIYEQLQSTNMEFEQVDTTLYIIGGYGFSSTANDHVTYPNLTAVSVPSVIQAIVGGQSILPYFRQITDANLQVTGGYLDKMGSTFYLAGGQMFEGRYNPMGPDHGPGFTQEYTNSIKQFEIVDDGVNMSVTNYSEWTDTANLHRRDYNMSVQIFPDGYTGFTMFSGVFQHTVNLPWLNTVDVRDTGYHVRPAFNQYLNQYHTAHLPIYDGVHNAMHTVFFGGMSRYTLDVSGQLVDDPNVPFVNTISRVTRYSDDSMQEFKDGEMPGLLGSGAEFIPLTNVNFSDEHHIVHLDSLPYTKQLVGYVIGGIESSQANIFFVNDGTQSAASNRVFEVYITRGITSVNEPISGDQFFTTSLFPNPSKGLSELKVSVPHGIERVKVDLFSSDGKEVQSIYRGSIKKSLNHTIDTQDLAPGAYFIVISSKDLTKTINLIVQ